MLKGALRFECFPEGRKLEYDHPCFLEEHHPAIELLSSVLPGRVAFGQIDAEVECNGHLLRVEHKIDKHKGEKTKRHLNRGQEIMFREGTRRNSLQVLVVWSDLNFERIAKADLWHRGERHSLPDPVTLEQLREWIGRWWHDHAVVG